MIKMLRLTKVIASSLIIASVLALNPIGASAEWKSNSTGWWYAEGNSWATGWRVIDGSLYYFDTRGYMFNTPNMFSEKYGLNSNGQFTNVTIDGAWAFDKTTGKIVAYVGSDSNVVIPEKINDVAITSIGVKAFQNCSSPISITIPSSVTSIGMDAFCFCNNLESVTILNGVTRLNSAAFVNCSSITSITIPNSVTSIRRDTFFNCINAKFYVDSEITKQLLINNGISESKILVNS